MSILFFISALTGLLYFLLADRRFDYFSLAFLSAAIYFAPGYLGFAGHSIGDTWIYTKINPETYAIMASVFVSITLFGWVSSSRTENKAFDTPPLSNPWLLYSALFFSIAGFVGMLFFSGSDLFNPEKTIVMESIGRWKIFFTSCISIGFALAYLEKRKKIFFVFLGFLLFDLYVGFRSTLVISILAVAVLHLCKQGKRRLIIKNYKAILLLTLLTATMLGYKQISFAIKNGDWELVSERLLGNNFLYESLIRSEPFIVQGNLNKVVADNFETDLSHIKSAIYQLGFFYADIGINQRSFNDEFQASLFRDVDYGMASNIWAQMWSAGGWFLFICFLIIFNFLLLAMNESLRSKSTAIIGGLSPAFCYFAFYIHRNDLSYTINLEKRIFASLLIMIFALATLRMLSGDYYNPTRHNSK